MTEGNPRGTDRIAAWVGKLRGKGRRGEPEKSRFVVPARRAGFSMRTDINGRQIPVTSTPLPAADLPARPEQEVAGSAKDSARPVAAATSDVAFPVIDGGENGAEVEDRPLTGAELFAAVSKRIAEKSHTEDLTEEEARFVGDELHQQTLLAGVTAAEEATARVATGSGRPNDMMTILAGARIKAILEGLLYGERADEPEEATVDIMRGRSVDAEITEERDRGGRFDRSEPSGASISGRAEGEDRPTVAPAKDSRSDKRAGPRVAVADRPQPLEVGNPVDLEKALEGMVAEPTHSPGPDERAVDPAEELEDTTAAEADVSSTDQTPQGLHIGKVGQSLADIMKPIPSDGDPARKEKIIYEGLNPKRRPRGSREEQRLYVADFPMSSYMQSEALGNGMDKWHQRYPGVQYNDEGAVFFKAVYEERGRFFSIYAGKQFEYKPGEVVRSRYVFGPKYADEPLEWRRGISVGNEWVAHQYGKKWGKGEPYKIIALWVPHSEITKVNLKGGYHPGKINVKSALVLGEVKYGTSFKGRNSDTGMCYGV